MYVRKQKTKAGKYQYYNNRGKISKEKYYKNLQYNKLEKLSKENKTHFDKKTYNKLVKAAAKENTSVKKQFSELAYKKRKEKIAYIKRTYKVNTGQATEILKTALEGNTNYKTAKELLSVEGMTFITDFLSLKKDLTENTSELFTNGTDANVLVNVLDYHYSGPVDQIDWSELRKVVENAELEEEEEEEETEPGDDNKITYPILANIMKLQLDDMRGQSTAATITLKPGIK